MIPQHSPTAAITGFIAGFLISIPVGPINLTIINEGARRGFRWALMIGFGSVLMESIYCGIALTGFSAFLGLTMVKSVMELLSFLFLLYLSWKYFSAKSIPSHTLGADMIEQKLHPRSAFMIGFLRVLGNPSVLLLWITLTATFLSHNWIDHTVDDRIACVVGVAAGATLWFVLLAWGVSKGHGRMSPRVLLRMEHVSGAVLLIAALWIGGRIVRQLHQQHQREKKERREEVSKIPTTPPLAFVRVPTGVADRRGDDSHGSNTDNSFVAEQASLRDAVHGVQWSVG
ncbi:MAG TPA: LysE family transporter [Candidatus Limnocylindria bacterium]|nr:LysE family transporter [Candidatus Limnocylindria bacterium]